MPRARKKPENSRDGRPPSAWSAAIRSWRQGRGISQIEAAEELGTSQTTFSDWENDRGMLKKTWFRVSAKIGASPSLFVQDDPGIPEEYSARRRYYFSRIFDQLSGIVEELGINISPTEFAYLVHTIWTRAALFDQPPSIDERIDVLIKNQREVWERHRPQK